MMTESIIKTESLTKIYHKTTVVQDINLLIEEGRIYGLIGKNGAGKTTLIKMLAGLIRPSGGKMIFFGQEGENALNKWRSKMSFMVEIPYMDEHMTACENLNLQRLQRGIKSKECIDEVLELVGLSKVGEKKVAAFSLGMKQRLGLAIAMLAKPKFLVLDEPLNGLDPEGIIEMRQLLRRLREAYGVTLLIASHLLSELYEVATDYIIMHEGKVLETLSEQELAVKCGGYIDVGIDQEEKAIEILKKSIDLQQYEVTKNGHIYIYDTVEHIERIPKTLVNAGVGVQHLSYYKHSLEDYFMSKITNSSIQGGKKDA